MNNKLWFSGISLLVANVLLVYLHIRHHLKLSFDFLIWAVIISLFIYILIICNRKFHLTRRLRLFLIRNQSLFISGIDLLFRVFSIFVAALVIQLVALITEFSKIDRSRDSLNISLTGFMDLAEWKIYFIISHSLCAYIFMYLSKTFGVKVSDMDISNKVDLDLLNEISKKSNIHKLRLKILKTYKIYVAFAGVSIALPALLTLMMDVFK